MDDTFWGGGGWNLSVWQVEARHGAPQLTVTLGERRRLEVGPSGSLVGSLVDCCNWQWALQWGAAWASFFAGRIEPKV